MESDTEDMPLRDPSPSPVSPSARPRSPAANESNASVAKLDTETRRALEEFCFDPEVQERIVVDNLTTKGILALLFSRFPDFELLDRGLVKGEMLETLQGEDPALAAFERRVLNRKDTLAACVGLVDERGLGKLSADKIARAEVLVALLRSLMQRPPHANNVEQRINRALGEIKSLIGLEPTRDSIDEYPGHMLLLRGAIAALQPSTRISPGVITRMHNHEKHQVLRAMGDFANHCKIEVAFRVNRPEDAFSFAPFKTRRAHMGWLGLSAPKMLAVLQHGLVLGETLTLYGTPTRAAVFGDFLCLVQVAEGDHCSILHFDSAAMDVVDPVEVDGCPVLGAGDLLHCKEECAAHVYCVITLSEPAA